MSKSTFFALRHNLFLYKNIDLLCKFTGLFSISALPPELYTFWEAYPWRFGEVYCYLKSYVQEMTSYASVLTIAAFTIERYLAICHPLMSQILNTPSRAVKLIFLQWILACTCAIPFPYYTRTFYTVYDPITEEPYENSLMCNIPNEHRDTMTYWFQVSTFVFFVYPMSIILVMYILIGCRLNRTAFIADRNNAATAKARKAVIKMLGRCFMHGSRGGRVPLKIHMW